MDVSTGDGYQLELFVCTLSDNGRVQLKDFECSLCKNICNNPKQCPVGHMFCNKCIELALEYEQKCPSCRVHLNTELLSTSLLAKKLINNFSIRCPVRPKSVDERCPWIGKVSEVDDHINTCEYLSIRCTNACCNADIIRKELASHRSTCPFQLLNCKHCNEMLPRRGLNIHMESCTSRSVTCANGDCGAIVKFKDLATHQHKCPCATVSCPLHLEGVCGDGCPKTLLRKNVDAHLQSLPGDTIALMAKEFVTMRKRVRELEQSAIERGSIGSNREVKVKKFQYASGDMYEGTLKDNKKSGHGVYKFVNGDIYEGAFKNDKKDGYGVYKFANGDIFEGLFKNDKKYGQGVYKYTDGEIYNGTFKDDKKDGFGVYKFADGEVYEGNFKNDTQNGRGVYKHANGNIYEGAFKDGLANGLGKCRFSNGDEYVGKYKDDKVHGRGVLTYPNGISVEQEYRDGILLTS